MDHQGAVSKALVTSNKAQQYHSVFQEQRYQSWTTVVSASEVEDCGGKPLG